MQISSSSNAVEFGAPPVPPIAATAERKEMGFQRLPLWKIPVAKRQQKGIETKDQAVKQTSRYRFGCFYFENGFLSNRSFMAHLLKITL